MTIQELEAQNAKLRLENQQLKNKIRLYELRFNDIWAIGFDYDGYYNSAPDLRDIIDELVAIAKGKHDDDLKKCYGDCSYE